MKNTHLPAWLNERWANYLSWSQVYRHPDLAVGDSDDSLSESSSDSSILYDTCANKKPHHLYV